jgi:hypothetical protein
MSSRGLFACKPRLRDRHAAVGGAAGWGAVMDSKDCRDNANRCVEMANNAADKRMQSTLFDLAKAWMNLATELESNEAFRDAVKGVDIFKPRRE